MNKRNYILALLFLFSSVWLGAQEICDNGIDDDGDGLIDLLDDDCECTAFVPSGLIPNPSFEFLSCCPQQEARLECAEAWIQASEATTDYFHTCGYLTFVPAQASAPLPFPDGDGCIGFRDGKPGSLNFKEYAGACLLESMEVGTEYTLDFFTGFPPKNQATSFEITLFATSDCSRLPFGQGNSNFGCPTNGNGWVQLDQLSISGNNEWINTKFSFVADQAYSAIVLGPGCDINPNANQQPYFFFDRLALAESSDFGVPFASIEGSICNNTLRLVFDEDPEYSFQWYKDGIAISGATNHDYIIPNTPDPEGTYVVIVSNSEGCFGSTEYFVEIPSYASSQTASICRGDVFEIGNNQYTDAGIFEVDLIASDGCDSTVTLELRLLEHTNAFLTDSVCFGDTYDILGESFTQAGIYELTTQNLVGCDSTITLDLRAVDANEGLDLGPDIEITLGNEISISPIQSDPNNIGFQWYDENNSLLDEDLILDSFLPISDQYIYLEAIDENGCLALDSVFLRVNRDIDLIVPNIFSPNQDGSNEIFFAIGKPSIIGLEEVYIFDRWGNLVFSDQDKSVGREQPVFEWDGKINGAKATEGVYVYLIRARVIDGSIIQKAGDVTLVR